MFRRLTTAAIAAIALALPAMAQETVTVTLSGVNEARGRVSVSLCTETAMVADCRGVYSGMADAKQGETTVMIPGVKAGAYALQIFHDANMDGRRSFPAEGFAFGNDAAFPPSFAAAAIKVDGPTSARATMRYADPTMGFTAMGAVRMGGSGVPAPPGIAKTDVRENGLYAELYAPEGRTNLPALILLSGSEGGLMSTSMMAQSFTRQGYAVLALAYFAETGLPRTLDSVPLEYFDKAVAWLKARSEVNPAKIGAIGSSRGSEAVLLMASRNKDIRAVAAIAPSGVMWASLDGQGAAWMQGGKPLPYLVTDFSAYRPGQPQTGLFVSALKARPGEAEIAVENINGPVLLLSGEDDQLWPSTPMANGIVARLKSKGFRHAVQHLSYPGAGHMIFAGDVSGRQPPPPGAPAQAPPGMVLGGTPQANFAAWSDNWPKTLKFFDDALKGS